MVTRRAILAFVIVYSVGNIAICNTGADNGNPLKDSTDENAEDHDKTKELQENRNNDASDKETKDQIPKTENVNVDSPSQEDISDVNSQNHMYDDINLKDVHRQNLKLDSSIEKNEDVIKNEHVDVTETPVKEPQTNPDSEIFIDTAQQETFEQGSHKAEQQEVASEAIGIDSIIIEPNSGDTNTEPVFPNENDERSEYEVHIDSSENAEQTDDILRLNIPNTDPLSVKDSSELPNKKMQNVDANLGSEEVNVNDNSQDKVQTPESNLDTKFDFDQGLYERYKDIAKSREFSDIESRREKMMETLVEKVEKETLNDEEKAFSSLLSDAVREDWNKWKEDNKPFDKDSATGQKLESKESLVNDDTSSERIDSQFNLDNADDTPDSQAQEGQGHAAKQSEDKSSFEKPHVFIEDTLDQIVQEFDKSSLVQEIPKEESFQKEEIVGELDENEASVEIPEDEEPMPQAIVEGEDFEFFERYKGEPERSNSPGTDDDRMTDDIPDSENSEDSENSKDSEKASEGDATSSETASDSSTDDSTASPDDVTPPEDKQDTTDDLGGGLYQEAMSLLNNSRTKTDPRIIPLLEKAAYDYQHQKSQEQLGRMYLFGESVAHNFSKAFELFEMAANVGSPKAQQMLGFMYASGISVNSSQSKALVYLTFSALGGDTMAEMTLGYRYYSGITVAENCETSLTYFRRVSSKVVADVSVIGGPVVQRSRLSDEVDQNSNNAMLDEDLIQYYQFLADKGDVQAQVGLGQLHYQGGRGVEQDFARAHRYFQLAADAGNANAYAFLGKLYSSGNSAVKANNETALKFFRKAAEMGNPVGQSGVGLMYLLGKGVQKDYTLAIKYFKLAADQGWVDGQLQLGTMYYHGLGVRRDYKQALKFFNLASQSGNIQAIYYLGTMYSSGTGIVRSCRTATELFKNVAERGRWSSMFMDAHKAYKSGYTNQALLKYAYLAELGYETAQSNVAFILDQELNTVMSDNYTYPRALLYWTRAAEQGNVGARVKVGDYYYYGQGTKVNYETAAFHYTLAQEQHRDAQAMFNLGYMHERGLGMKQDVHLAKRFYDMAAETNPDAQAPVTLALMKLGVIYGLDWLSNNYDFWSHVHINMDEHLGKDWDIYAMTVLAILVGLLILLRWR